MPWLPSFSTRLPKSQCAVPWQVTRLHDLVPTTNAAGWLYGDDICWIEKVKTVRAELRAGSTHPTDEELEG